MRRAICFYMKQEGYGRGRRMGNGREGVGEGLSGAVAEALGVSECSTPSPPPPSLVLIGHATSLTTAHLTKHPSSLREDG